LEEHHLRPFEWRVESVSNALSKSGGKSNGKYMMNESKAPICNSIPNTPTRQPKTTKPNPIAWINLKATGK